MAIMYPERIPEQVRADPLLAAERRVYRRLKDTLDDDFVVMYRVPYLVRDDEGRSHEGEADFVVGHEQEGLLVLEVKGGGIARDGHTGRWRSRDAAGVEHEIQDPFGQARRNSHSLLRKVKQLPDCGGRWIPMSYGVVFPDSGKPRAALGPDAPLSVCAFAEDMGQLGERVRQILRAGATGSAPERPAARPILGRIVDCLAPSFRLDTPLAPAAMEEERKLVELTEQQFWLLGTLAANPRVLVKGGAGTGKTLLALEHARRLAAQGRRTLLTCFNRNLADFLRQKAAEWKEPAVGRNLTIRNFHQLCYRWARKAKLQAVDPDGPRADGMSREYFDEVLPRRLRKAAEAIKVRFDAVIVDEGQDLTDACWEALEATLADREGALIYIFRDEGQHIYDIRSHLFKGMMSVPLTRNCRNTRKIHDAVIGVVDDGTQAIGPAGRKPRYVRVRDDAEEREALARVLTRLIEKDEFRPEQIAILTAAQESIPALAPEGKIGAYATTRNVLDASGKVLIQTIQRFKGLERSVVILAGLHDPPDHIRSERGQLYVGMSRARVHLVVIGRPDVLDPLDPAGA